MEHPPDRTLTAWLVLGLLAEAPSHGFALAKQLAPGGEVGQVWSATRPLTYRAIDDLVADGLVRPVRTEAAGGPRRTVLAPTAAGRRALARWLATPVPRFRLVRSELLAKLLLLERSGEGSGPLLTAQRAVFEPLVADARAGADGVVTRWRAAQADAIDAFLRS